MSRKYKFGNVKTSTGILVHIPEMAIYRIIFYE